VSDPFHRPPVRCPTFHGRVSTDRADKGYNNYLILTGAGYRLRIFLNGEEQKTVTADPEAGIVQFYQGIQMVTLYGNVEIKLERDKV
jgi:hypothetical protein